MNATGSLATIFPAMRWYGWRPPFLDQRAEDRNGHLVLLLEREGETILLPCAIITYCFAFLTWEDWQESDTLRRIWGNGVDAETLELAVHQLEADGWQVIGRLVIDFIGVLAEDDFWQQVRAVLREHTENL